MDQILCNLCNTIVRCGKEHTCLFYNNDGNFNTIQEPGESEEINSKHDTTSVDFYTENLNNSSVETYSNFQVNNVKVTSEVSSQTAKNNEQISLLSASMRKRKYPSLIPGTSKKTYSSNSRDSSSLDSAVSIQKGKVNSRGNDSQIFCKSEDVKSPTTLANTDFSLCKKKQAEFDPEKDILDTRISKKADINSFSSNRNMEFNREQSKEITKDVAAVAGVPVTKPRLHTSAGKRKHSRDLCSRQFTDKGNLLRPNETDTLEKPYECDECGLRFRRRGDLDIHYRIHTGEKPYECNVCGRKFSQKGNLNTHYRTHTGEKPFACVICGKGFTQKGNLDIHSRTHTGERRFECDVCGKEFDLKGNLNTHYRIHTGEKPFPCETCGKRFTQKKTLDVHSRTHTGERPFECEICEKDFAHENNYREHVAEAHAQKRPFKCGVCGKAFMTNGARNQHREDEH